MKRIAILALGLLAAASAARAQAPQVTESPPAMAEHRLALQISESDPAREQLLLNVVGNALKQFGAEHIAIEVVAFGPGIELLRQGNPKESDLRELVQKGVKFDACQNTIDGFERREGHPFPLTGAAVRVPAGVPRLMTLAEHGYTVIRP